MKRILLTVIFLLSFTVIFAANRFWVRKGADNNWSNTLNWSTTSGGAGGATVPGAGDAVLFNGSGNFDCNIDVPVTVQSVSIAVSYISTITQNGNNITCTAAAGWVMNAGIFVGGSGNFSTTVLSVVGAAFTSGSGTLTTTGNFTLNGGFFAATTGKVRIGGAFSLTKGDFTESSDSTFFGGAFSVNPTGTNIYSFSHNNGTTVLNSQNSVSLNIDGTNSGFITFWNLVLQMKTVAPNNLTVALNDVITVLNYANLISGVLLGTGQAELQIFNTANIDVQATFGGASLQLFFTGTGTNNYRLDAPYSTRNGAWVQVQKDNNSDSVHIRSITPGKTITDGFNNVAYLYMQIGVVDYPDNNRVVLNFSAIAIFSSATYIATSDSLFNNGDHVNNTGVFLHNNGTYIFAGTASRALSFDPSTRETFYNFVLNKPNINNNLTLDQGDTAVVENNMVIENGELIAGSGPNTSGFRLNGNLTAGAGMSATSIQFQFAGAGDQTITLDPAVTGNLDGNIIISKPAVSNVILNSPVTLDAGPTQVLTFTQGIIQSTATNLLTLGDANTVTGANNNSYTTGPVRKIGLNWFEFPVGAGNFYAPIRVTGGGGNPTDDLDGASTFDAEYLKVNPDALFPVASREDPPLTNVSQCEYWMLAKDAVSPNAYVWLGYDNTRSCGVTNPSLLRVARWDGSMWRDEGNGTVATTPLVRTANSQSNFGLPFTLASLDATANSLPITLTEFLGRAKDDVVELKWTTETEINNKYFDIERSLDGRSFASIGTVPGAGNTTLVKHYSLTDQNPANGINYYRLKQVDFNGNFTYSKVIAIPVTKLNATVKIYPNPAISNITAEYKGFVNAKVTVQLIDNYGRVVLNSIQQPGASGRVDLQLTNAVKTAGTYWLKMSTDKETIQQKVVINQP